MGEDWEDEISIEEFKSKIEPKMKPMKCRTILRLGKQDVKLVASAVGVFVLVALCFTFGLSLYTGGGRIASASTDNYSNKTIEIYEWRAIDTPFDGTIGISGSTSTSTSESGDTSTSIHISGNFSGDLWEATYKLRLVETITGNYKVNTGGGSIVAIAKDGTKTVWSGNYKAIVYLNENKE